MDLNKIAYDFEYELDNWPVDHDVYQELVSAIEAWQRLHASRDRPFLYYSKALGYVTVYDGRNPREPSRRRYDGAAAQVIEICNEAAKSMEQIRGSLAGQSEEALSPVLEDLCARRILYEERGKYFTLAIPENPYL